jgi:hypothetical protein
MQRSKPFAAFPLETQGRDVIRPTRYTARAKLAYRVCSAKTAAFWRVAGATLSIPGTV